MPPKTRSRTTTRHRHKPDPLAREVGTRVARLRKERGFTFDAFVEECGLGRGYVSELERGLVVPTIHALAKVAAALELSMADLVLGDSPRERLMEVTRDLGAADVGRLLEEAERLRKTDRGGVRP
jgi:transcriptional regulator with XRE-family HTH domain